MYIVPVIRQNHSIRYFNHRSENVRDKIVVGVQIKWQLVIASRYHLVSNFDFSHQTLLPKSGSLRE